MRMYSPLFLAAATVSGAAVLAQQDDRSAPERQTPSLRAPDHVFLDDVLGAKVSIQPGAEARREAAQDDEKAKRGSGEIKDLILECRSGNIECAIITFGGVLGLGDKAVALPATLLTWNGANKCFDLSANEDQLKTLSAFDLKEARKRGLDNEMVVVRSGWTKLDVPQAVGAAGKPLDATGDKGAAEKRKADAAGTTREEPPVPKGQDPAPKGTTVAGTSFVVVPARYIVASEVDDHPVYAFGEKFGKIEKCIVDRNARSLAYCVVSHGGALGIGDTEYLLPHRALTLCRDGDNYLYCLSRTAEQLKTGVKYEKPKQGGVLDPDAARRADTMN